MPSRRTELGPQTDRDHLLPGGGSLGLTDRYCRVQFALAGDDRLAPENQTDLV